LTPFTSHLDKGEGAEHEASRRVKSEILVQMDGVCSSAEEAEGGPEKHVIVLGATNFPWELDDGMEGGLVSHCGSSPKAARKACVHPSA
jgi:hypothetical protein